MSRLRKVLGEKLFWKLKFFKEKIVQLLVKFFNLIGLNFFPARNYYSPLPLLGKLEKNNARWNKTTELVGVKIDSEKNEALFTSLVDSYLTDYKKLIPFEEAQLLGFGPGYTYVDSFTTYGMLKKINPKTYFEVGSGLSTYYASQALDQNGNDAKIICVEPYPYAKLQQLKDVTLIKDEVQNVDFEKFDVLEEGDVLFIDSTHVVKIDGDVPYLFLEILPRLKKGVYIHIHDIPFPYNIPYPTDFWVFKRAFPMYWTEAMLLQAFLAFNSHFEILLSTPMIRHQKEELLMEKIPNYKGINEEPNTFSSIWLKKVQ